jgi:hypothetical protein
MSKGSKHTKNTNATESAPTKTTRTKKSKSPRNTIPLARLMPLARNHDKRPWAESGKLALHLASNIVVQSVVDQTISSRDERKRIQINDSDLTNGSRAAFSHLKGVSDPQIVLGPLLI